MNPCVKTEGKFNESVTNEFKIMSESNSLHEATGSRAAFFIHTQQINVARFLRQNLSMAPKFEFFISTCNKMIIK